MKSRRREDVDALQVSQILANGNSSTVADNHVIEHTNKATSNECNGLQCWIRGAAWSVDESREVNQRVGGLESGQ